MIIFSISNFSEDNQRKIEQELTKILSLIPKLKLSENQRLPINSKVHPGKWFLHLNSSQILSLVLAFPNADENLVERFLSKTTNAFQEAELLLPDREKFITHLDDKVKKYGLHCLHDSNNLNSLSKIEFSESLFQDSSISEKNNEPMSPPTEIIQQMTQNDPKEIIPAPIEEKIIIPDQPIASTENFDFFEFDSPNAGPVNNIPQESNQIMITDASSTAVPSSIATPQSAFKGLASKPVQMRLARYLMGIFTILMFFFILKMFSDLGSNTEQVSPNHVRFSSSHHHHHRV
jgi:hypothetical protein